MAADIDLTAMLRAAADRAAASPGSTVEISVPTSLIVSTEAAEESAFTVAGLVVDRIKRELEGSSLPVAQATRERRARAQSEDPKRSRTGGRWRAERYPGGYQPNPEGAYGEDSGYLRDNILINIASGKKDVFAGIPKNRQKAAFVIRRMSPTARGGSELRGAVAEATRAQIRKVIQTSLRKALRGSGVRGRLV